MKIITPPLMTIRRLSLPTVRKIRTLGIAVALSFTAAITGFSADPRVGTWNLDESESTFAPGMGKNTRVVFSRKRGGLWEVDTTIDRVNKRGKRTQTHTIWIGKHDGKPYPVKGSKSYDEIAYTEDGFTALKKGKVVMTGTISHAQKDKSRVVIASGTNASGKKIESKAKYDRQ